MSVDLYRRSWGQSLAGALVQPTRMAGRGGQPCCAGGWRGNFRYHQQSLKQQLNFCKTRCRGTQTPPRQRAAAETEAQPPSSEGKRREHPPVLAVAAAPLLAPSPAWGLLPAPAASSSQPPGSPPGAAPRQPTAPRSGDGEAAGCSRGAVAVLGSEAGRKFVTS